MSDFQKLRKIIFINQTLSEGGAEYFNRQLLTWFVSQGVKVKALTTLDLFRKRLKKSGIETQNIPIVIDIIGDWKGLLKGIFLFVPGIFYYAKLVIKNRNEGVILLSGYIEKILVTPWAKLLNVPVVWVEHGPLSPILNRFFGFPKILYRFVARFPDYVIFPSEFSMNNNLNISGIDKTKVIVVNDGIMPLKKYQSKIVRHTAYCASRLEEGKGQDILVRAWKKVIEKFPDAKLYIIGTGDFKTKLEKLVDELNLQGNVILTGWVEDLAKKISTIELGVFPSVWNLEGFGVVLLEAMSLGKPIVCFNHGPYPEVVDKRCALIVKQKNPESLSRAIIKVFSDQDLSKSLGVEGNKKFDKLFTIKKCGSEYTRIFEKAINDRRLFKNTGRITIYLFDLLNKGFYSFIKDRIKKRKILRWILYLFTKNFVVINGKKLYIDKMDTVISDKLINEGIWEPGSTKIFKDYAKKSRLIVDVGANIGYYTLIAAEFMKKNGKVVAFEPSNVNYCLLSKTVNENDLKNVVLVKKAVGDTSSIDYLYSGDKNFGDRKMYKASLNDSREKVEVVTLDNYFIGDEQIDMLKIDIEGYEVKAFKGAKKLFEKRKVKVIISELRPESLELAKDDWCEYIDLLEKFGFIIFNIDEETGEISDFSKERTLDDYKNDRHLTINILALLK